MAFLQAHDLILQIAEEHEPNVTGLLCRICCRDWPCRTRRALELAERTWEEGR